MKTELNVKNFTRDYKTLAGKMEFTVKKIKQLELKGNPTDALLTFWRTKSGNTVNKLIEILKAIENDQVAKTVEQAVGKISIEL